MRTLIVAGVLFLVLFVLALTMPVPYVILSPGPTYNTLGTDDQRQRDHRHRRAHTEAQRRAT